METFVSPPSQFQLRQLTAQEMWRQGIRLKRLQAQTDDCPSELNLAHQCRVHNNNKLLTHFQNL
jgi:hypothetical protein